MKHLALFLLLVTSLFAQPWAAPSGRSMPGGYSVGVGGTVGVDGGVPPRTDPANIIDVTTHPSILADKTGVADARGPIESWLAAGNGSGKVLFFPAGTYKFNYYLALRSNMTFRGEVDANGVSLVTINSNGYGGFGGGDGGNFANDATTKGKFSGSKGDTVITTYELSGAYGSPVLEANRLITMNVDPADVRRQIGYTRHPDIKNGSWWVGYVKSVSGSNITVEPPLPYDVTEGTFALGYGAPVQNSGIENFIVNGEAPYSMQTGIIMQGNTYNTWVKNVKVVGQTNYGISYPIAVRYEISGCEVAPAGVGSNHGGILIGNSTLGYIYDNIVNQNNPNTEFNFGFYGNIVAYNYLTGGTMNVNHGPLNLQNLYEGNYAEGMQSDGYFGGAWWGEFYRNWLSGDGRAPIALNRDAIEWMFVGNVFGQPGATSQYRPSSGNPNMGNGSSTGTRSTSGAKSTLTTRTSDSVGVITAPSGHGITTGATIDVYWMKTINSGGYDYPVAHIRYGMTVGTVSGTNIPVSGGLGDVLPADESEIYVPVADANLAEYSISWDKTTGAIRTWAGTIATRPDDYNATVTIPDTTLLAANIAATNSGSALLSIYWTGANLGGYYCVASLSGSTLTINMPYGNMLPANGTSVIITTNVNGRQELDLDTLYTAIYKGNHDYFITGVPPEQALGGTTLPDSRYLGSKPAWMGNKPFPTFGPDAVPSAYDNANKARLPAAHRAIYNNRDYMGGTSTPQFSPTPGSYSSTQNVTITSSTPSSTIYYTTNGTDPTTSSSVYSTAISVAATTTIKAFATAASLTDSSIASGTYTITAGTVSTPTFSPAAGTYSSTQSVTITCSTPSSTIYYTTNGSSPTTGSSVYSSAISVPTTTTIRAFATAAGMTDSAVASPTYTISPGAGGTGTITTDNINVGRIIRAP